MSHRDPRITPISGDVLRSGTGGRERHVTGVYKDSEVSYRSTGTCGAMDCSPATVGCAMKRTGATSAIQIGAFMCRQRSKLHKIDATPGFIKMLKGSKYLSFRELIPQSQLYGRTQIVPQAKVLGGGSTVNAQVYMRGRAADWDAWRTLTGSDLWSWDAILPHFVAQEGNAKFNDEFHGTDGPMLVSDPGYICEMSQIYVRAAQEAGMRTTQTSTTGSARNRLHAND